MILSTHAIVGAAIARMIPEHLALGFILAFLSHFALDAIPHWDYRLRSLSFDPERPLDTDMRIGKVFFFDLARISMDFGIGIFVALAFFGYGGTLFLQAALCGAVGGVAPDALQFAYFKIRREPFILLQRFHRRMHAKRSLEPKIGNYMHQIIVAIIAILATLSLGK